MNTLKRKLNKQSGFTLIEMLVVVAIIAILVAVSIPVAANALERSKHATDAANERAAKAEILIQYLAEEDGKPEKIEVNKAYYYNAADGVLVVDAPKPYGKHDTQADRTESFIAVSVDADGKVSMAWTKAEITGTTGVTADTNLCSEAADTKHTVAGGG